MLESAIPIRAVIIRSSDDGFVEPDGWLCVKIIAAALFFNTFFTISLGYTAELVIEPENIFSIAMM